MSLQIPPGSFQGLIFDFDGTLVDSMMIHQKAWQKALESLGGQFPISIDDYLNLGGTSTHNVAKLFLEKNNLTPPPEELVRRKEECFAQTLHQVQPIESVLEQALDAKTKGLKIAIASGSSYPLILSVLDHLKLTAHFPLILTPKEVLRSKPAPDLFLLAAEKMSLSPSTCLVFEDSPLGIQAAESAGMASVTIPKTLWRDYSPDKHDALKKVLWQN